MLDKAKGSLITSSPYRPLCMKDVRGKLLEKLIRTRLRAAIEAACGLAENQQGFREGKSVLLQDILDALENRFRVPVYIRRLISDYIIDRWLTCDTIEGPGNVQIATLVAQGPVLGRDLCNVVYDGILTIELSDGTKLLNFADHLAATITGRTEEQTKTTVAFAPTLFKCWDEEYGLSLANKKTETVLLS